MKGTLKQAFKPTPERFEYTVRTAVSDAVTQSTPIKKRLSKGWRIAIAAVLVAALLPTTVFGASKLYSMLAKSVDKYGLSLDVERDAAADYPEYVKMHVETPEGFAPNDPDDGYNTKFYSLSATEPRTDGFSLYPPMRFTSNSEQKEYIGNVGSYETLTLNGHQAYEVKMANGAWDRLYVYYEDVNVLLMIYHKDVTDEQIERFVKGISFTEGTPDDFTHLVEPYDERPQEQVGYSYDIEYIELHRDAALTYNCGYSESSGAENLPYTSKIENIRTTDNISGLDPTAINSYFDLDEIADDSGRLLPQTTRIIKEGDGFTAMDEILSETESEQVVVLADITYTNKNDEDIQLYIPYHLNILDKNSDGSLTPAGRIDEEQKIYADGYYEIEPFYLSPHGDSEKSYYIPTLPAHSTITVTVGFLCNADKLDQAYLIQENIGDVSNPQYNSSHPYAVYCFKVQ